MRDKFETFMGHFSIAYLLLLLPVLILDDDLVLTTYLVFGLIGVLAMLVDGTWLLLELVWTIFFKSKERDDERND